MSKPIAADPADILEKIVGRLLSADEEARRMYDAALDERRQTENELAERKARIKEMYLNKTQGRIEAIRDEETAKANEKLARIEHAAEENLRKLEEKSDANLELWAEQIFKAVISD